jgi:hypothetical protein
MSLVILPLSALHANGPYTLHDLILFHCGANKAQAAHQWDKLR